MLQKRLLPSGQQRSLLGVGELQADEVEDLWSVRRHEILDKLAELHLAVCLPRHVDHVDDFVAACVGDRTRFSSNSIRQSPSDEHRQLFNCCCVGVGFRGGQGPAGTSMCCQTGNRQKGALREGGRGEVNETICPDRRSPEEAERVEVSV